jgi:hypothetical protein
MFSQISRCRICGNTSLQPVLSLGEQSLTGIFPRKPDVRITTGPLELVRCHGEGCCGLLQLRHSYDLSEMYGPDYGYRSSLNRSMVTHLESIARSLMQRIPLSADDLVLDIGSNDGTLLRTYPEQGPTLVGMDPSAGKFRKYYRPDIHLIVDFFSAERLAEQFPGRKARIVTSIAMFYDLEDPIPFMQQIQSILADDGVWLFEQSYMPAMLRVNAYDTICHEHLEYYGLTQIKWMADRAGLKILDVEINNVNGGSFAVIASKADSPHEADDAKVDAVLREEISLSLHTAAPYEAFAARVFDHRTKLRAAVQRICGEGKSLLGYGASTKGNVILQFCGFGPADIPAIAEVNADKFGCFTPGTGIPIISETDAHAMHPDYLLVLPWHFRENLLAREAKYLAEGGRMLFPLPEIEIVPS